MFERQVIHLTSANKNLPYLLLEYISLIGQHQHLNRPCVEPVHSEPLTPCWHTRCGNTVKKSYTNGQCCANKMNVRPPLLNDSPGVGGAKPQVALMQFASVSARKLMIVRLVAAQSTAEQLCHHWRVYHLQSAKHFDGITGVRTTSSTSVSFTLKTKLSCNIPHAHH